MSLNIHNVETKLSFLLAGTFLASIVLHVVWLIPLERQQGVANAHQAEVSAGRHLALTAGLLLLSGSVMVILVRRAKRRFRDLLEAIRDGGAPSIHTGKKGDEIERFASSVWQLFEKLRKSEQKYRELVDSSHGLILAADANQNITFVGRGLKETLGYEPEDVMGTPLFRACHPDDLERAERAFQRVIAGERLQNFEARYAHKSGGWVDLLGNVSPIHESGKDVHGVLIAAVEVTETKNLERRLRLLSTAVESSTDIVSIAGLNGRILYMNPAGVRAFGYGPQELIGRNARELSLQPEEKIAEVLRRIREEGKWTDRRTLKRKDGSVFPCELAVTVIKDSRKRPFAMVGVGRDITERLEAEDRLRQSQKMETVGILAGGIAHDFNNILGGIVGYASILKSSVPKDSSEHRYASLIEKAGARASELTSGLLSFARKGKGRPFPTDLNGLVEEAVTLLQSPVPKNGDVRSCLHGQRLVVEADPTQIHQAILNVLINARDAAGPIGKIEIKSYVEEADADFCKLHPKCAPGRYAVISIEDDGPGIDAEAKKRAFEPFFSTKTDRRRTGLGLAITYNIIGNHGGCVEIDSEPGRGTAVRIYLPLSEKEIAAPAAGPELVGGSETVLVIDDDEMIRSVLSDMLRKLGYGVILASSSEAGIGILRERKGEIDLVIIDMMLADMGGEEALRQLKTIDRGLKTLLSSAHPLDASASESLRERVGGFIHKPYSLEELSRAVREALDQQ